MEVNNVDAILSPIERTNLIDMVLTVAMSDPHFVLQVGDKMGQLPGGGYGLSDEGLRLAGSYAANTLRYKAEKGRPLMLFSQSVSIHDDVTMGDIWDFVREQGANI